MSTRRLLTLAILVATICAPTTFADDRMIYAVLPAEDHLRLVAGGLLLDQALPLISAASRPSFA